MFEHGFSSFFTILLAYLLDDFLNVEHVEGAEKEKLSNNTETQINSKSAL